MFTPSRENATVILVLIIAVLIIIPVFIITQDGTPIAPAEDAADNIVDFTVESAESAALTLEGLLERLTTVPRTDVARVLLAIGGVILLVAGWRVYDFVVIIAGFLIGALLATSLVNTDNTLVAIAALLIGGLLGAVLSYFLYYAAVFLIGAYIGILLINALAGALTTTPVSPLVLLIGGIIGGVILVALSFEFLVILSAIVGAQMLTLALALPVLWTLVFAVIGVIVQLGLIRAFRYDFRRRPRRWTPFRRYALNT